MKYKFLLLILISMGLASCAGKQSNTQKFIRNLDNEILKNYKLPHGNLIAMYDLAKVEVKKNNRIYASDYILTINDETQNNLFLNKFKKNYKNSNALWSQAGVKNARIKDLMLKLHSKYRFLNASEVGFLNSKTTNINAAFNELARLDKMTRSIPIMLPEHNPRVSSHYGMRKHPIKKKNKFHCGIDLVALKSTPVYAAASGVVGKIDRAKGYGNTILLKHSHKFKTRYAHLKSIIVKEGERVLKGQKIGVQGRSGNATGEHLHFEVWLDNKHIDPFDFLAHAEIINKR
jgi:murein DD-endopeptidase MepM/ murein hydrolase activator NlpD